MEADVDVATAADYTNVLKERLRLSARQEFALQLIRSLLLLPLLRFTCNRGSRKTRNTRSPKSIAYLLATINAARQGGPGPSSSSSPTPSQSASLSLSTAAAT